MHLNFHFASGTLLFNHTCYISAINYAEESVIYVKDKKKGIFLSFLFSPQTSFPILIF